MKIKNCIFILFFILLNNILSKNIYLKQNYNITVLHNNDTLISPFIGGLTSVQVANADMQNDGFKDLVIYDIYSNRILIYKNINNLSYILDTTNYSFPNLNSWVEVFDYNCDNIPDIFTYNNIGSITIYKGTYINQKLSFVKKQNEILAQSFFGNNVNVYATAIDKPSFADVNSDGDVDIVGFNVFANKLIYYENQKVELQLPCDSFYCRIQDFCWGNISESFSDGELVLRDTCSSKFLSTLEENAILHNGSNITVADISGDGKIDALIGDLFFNQLTYLENQGTQQYASFLSQTKNFPIQKNIAIDFLPLAQFVDINFDNKKDLVVSNFSYTSTDANDKNIWYYKNISNSSAMNFEFVEDNFILKETIDVGRNSSVCFVDINNDNKLDLLLSNGGQSASSLAMDKYFIRAYQNIGTNEAPKFKLVDSNFLNITQHLISEIQITAGDIDNDSDIDIVAGTHDGNLVWWENNNSSYTYKNHLISDAQIRDSLGSYLRPSIIDLDRDNLNDIVVGNQKGKLVFLKGISNTQPNFQLISTQLSNIHTINSNEILGYAAPTFADLDNNGQLDLIIGTHSAGIWYYKDFETNYTSNNIEPQKININNYNKLCPSFLNNQLYIGNSIGGITSYLVDTILPTFVSKNNIKNIHTYPNPTTKTFYIELEKNNSIDYIEISSVLGNNVQMDYIQKENSIRIDLIDCPKGMYLIKIIQENTTYISKILVE